MPPPSQPRPLLPPSPTNDGLPYARDFQNIDTGVGNTSVVNTAFIEAVAQSMGFQETDEDYRSSLHSIPMVCCIYT